jgi:hypothetical protein
MGGFAVAVLMMHISAGSSASISRTPWQAPTSPSEWAPGIVMSNP